MFLLKRARVRVITLPIMASMASFCLQLSLAPHSHTVHVICLFLFSLMPSESARHLHVHEHMSGLRQSTGHIVVASVPLCIYYLLKIAEHLHWRCK